MAPPESFSGAVSGFRGAYNAAIQSQRWWFRRGGPGEELREQYEHCACVIAKSPAREAGFALYKPRCCWSRERRSNIHNRFS